MCRLMPRLADWATYLTLIFLMVVISSCNEKSDKGTVATDGESARPEPVLTTVLPQEKRSEESGWSRHIMNYPQGWVSASEVIELTFNHDVATIFKGRKPLPDNVQIEPSITFDVYLSDTDTLIIDPKEPLLAGQVYAISLKPKNLLGIDANLPVFRFQVQVLKQDFDLKVAGLVPSQERGQMNLTGEIKTRDRTEPGDVERMVKAHRDQQSFDFQWQHQPDGLTHSFTIAGIERQDQSSKLTLEYVGEPIGVNKDGQHVVEIPELNRFTVTAVRTEQKPQQVVEVSFSEALDNNQNLIGLVRLNGQPAQIKVDGASLLIYPPKSLSGKVELEIDDTLRSAMQLHLSEQYRGEVIFISQLPGVRYVNAGSILPPGELLTVPIEAINVNAVWITAFKVYENNLQQFFQSNQLRSNYVDTRSGRYLWRKKITLPEVPVDQWKKYEIDVTELMDTHADGLVNLRIHIDKSTIAYPCATEGEATSLEPLKNYEGPGMEVNTQKPAWFNRYYSQTNGYVTYQQRKNPCHPAYYYYYDNQNVFSARYFTVSDIGLIAKRGTGNALSVVATRIRTGKPLNGAELELYNYQHQLVVSGKTDERGMAVLPATLPGFYLIARHGEYRSFLRLPRNEALPTSQFDVGGEPIESGLKGFIYGERDVWRPGDDIYLTFILQDKLNQLPQNHPVDLDFFDPKGTKHTTIVNSQPVGNLYTFKITTAESAPTGNWRAVVRVGGDYFDKIIKVETIVPNRLKVELTPSIQPLTKDHSPIRFELYAQWLNGATAKQLKVKSEVRLSPLKTQFDRWGQFHFDDPASGFKSSKAPVFDGALDDRGRAAFDMSLDTIQNAPGKLKATFVTRVFEQGGQFSTNISTEEVLPYKAWVGLNIPKGDGWGNAIARNRDHPIDIISLNSMGEELAKRSLTISVFHVGWRWWWDQSEEDLANYVRSQSNALVVEDTLVTNEHGRAQWILQKDRYQWGRHIVRVCDSVSGHCAGKEVYLGWSWGQQVNPDAATQLMISTDKTHYEPGDVARIQLPELTQGQVLYSLESGSRVLEQKWLNLPAGQAHFDIPIREEMAPNIYLNVVLLLPHKHKQADAPIRMYGIVPLMVDNPNNRLRPIIDVPDQVRPRSTFTVKVSEQNQRKMNYTVAVVDEGLLGITGYRAPDPYQIFYRREALGVFTWDLFDGVVGAYGANLERLLKIGGGEKGGDDSSAKQRRFPPVVRFLGAFSVEAGKQAQHEVTLPQYMGAVRVMVVAEADGAFGRSEETVTVTQPLTILATLPRVLGPQETVSLPVNVFVSDETIDKVDIEVRANDLIELDDHRAQVHFERSGDQILLMGLKVKNQLGQAQITVIARAGEEHAEQTLHVPIRSANLPTIQEVTKVLQPGELWQPQLQPHGLLGTNQASVTVSRIPALSLERRLEYLIRYPHGCVEQTTSAIFPQIWLDNLVDLSPQQRDEIQANVAVALQKLRRFQDLSGAFSYWPGQAYVNIWSSIYVTHFLLEAQQKGYAVPQVMLDNALRFLRQAPSAALKNQNYDRLVNSYRLYVLVIAGTPEVAQMNRTREALIKSEKHYDDRLARWLLVMAYQKLGLADVARELFARHPNGVENSTFRAYTYGSTLRDKALLLQTLSSNQDHDQAWELATELAKMLSKKTWYSTHSLSWAMLSMAKFSQTLSPASATFSISEQPQTQWQSMAIQSAAYRHPILAGALGQEFIKVRNDSQQILHVTVANKGVAEQGKEVADSHGIAFDVQFMDLNQQPLDIQALPQGQDFIAEISVRGDQPASDYAVEDIALSMVVPSGWQIRNQRLEGELLAPGLDYQDIRDDRVLSYFSLWNNHYWRYRYHDKSQNSITFRVILNASFAGQFYLPGWQVNAMYDEDIYAYSVGRWVQVKAQ